MGRMLSNIYLYALDIDRVQLFQRFEKFRVIVLGGDGSIGWVLSTLDKYNLHSKVRIYYCEMGGEWEGLVRCIRVHVCTRYYTFERKREWRSEMVCIGFHNIMCSILL